jgi:hypothetical protein
MVAAQLGHVAGIADRPLRPAGLRRALLTAAAHAAVARGAHCLQTGRAVPTNAQGRTRPHTLRPRDPVPADRDARQAARPTDIVHDGAFGEDQVQGTWGQAACHVSRPRAGIAMASVTRPARWPMR